MGNPWKVHVDQVRKLNPGKSLKEILQLASGSYERSPDVKNNKKHPKKHDKKHGKKHNGGGDCMLPAADGSGSVTQADAVQCGTAPNACAPAPEPAPSQSGGKRKSRKSRKSRKARKSRKSRKARKSRKSRKSRKRRRK